MNDIKRLLRNSNFIILNKGLVLLLGLDAAGFLAYLIDAENMFAKKEGIDNIDSIWFWQTNEQIEKFIGLKYDKTRRLSKVLMDWNIIETKRKGIPAKMHYKINVETLQRLVEFPIEKVKLSERDTVKNELKLTLQKYPKTSSGENPELQLGKTQNSSQEKPRTIYKEINKEINNKEKNNIKKDFEGLTNLPLIRGKNVNNPNNNKITPKQFDMFWKLYPKSAGKGTAKSTWEKLCHKSDRPTWAEIKNAITAQKQSERWQTEKYIKHAATWLNNYGWLDDATEMKAWDTTIAGKCSTTYTADEEDYWKTRKPLPGEVVMQKRS